MTRPSATTGADQARRLLRALLVEDSPDDTELLLAHLERGYEVVWERVETREGLAAALDRGPWDAIFSDFSLPSFSGPDALALCRARGLDVPFLIVSGTVSEGDAVESMKAGAHDFINKNNMVRLLPALARELRESQGRRARREAEQALQKAQAQYRQLIESVHAIVWRADAHSQRFTFVSAEAEAILGYPVSRWREPGFWQEHLHPDDREEAIASWRRAAQREGSDHCEYRMVAADGRAVWLRDVVSPVVEDEQVKELIGVMVDVSERRGLEAQLLQGQKIEAIGRLAGGVAHDFNNLLGVITGYAQLLGRDLEPGHKARGRLEQIRKAADRAASLTRQLLAFSRKQVLQPRLLDLNDVLTGMEELLRRLIGEDVELITSHGVALWPIKADPGQMEQVILNLAVNARDAMPRGGQLILETTNVQLDESYARLHVGARTGPHVLLAVSDTGHGMGAEVQAHIFEPFFTTKPEGKGTGLGLATVYGIVKQSGGYIAVHSEAGRGATFKVYLPRAEPEEHHAKVELPPAPPLPQSGSGTVLVVEDDAALRNLVREVLEAAGYRVLEAMNPDEALRLCRSFRGTIHLLVTDVVMPGSDGPGLAGRIVALSPGTRVLYMSGYTDEAIGHHGVLDAETQFLHKPFTSDALLGKVRESLRRGGSAQADGGG